MQRHHRSILSRLLMVPSFALIFVSLLLVTPVLAATLMPIPAQSSSFSGNTRGYYFTAPSCFTITSLFVPTTASTADQHIQIVKLTATPPLYATTTNNFVSLGLWRNQPGTDVISTNIKIAAGDIIGILGSRGTTSSYGSGSFATTINGQPITLNRLGMQFPLATTDARDLWTEASGSISRVEMNYEGGCFTSGALVAATYGMPYSHTFVVADTSSVTFAVASETLPPGLSLDASTGVLSGTPTQAGTFTFTIMATGSSGSITQQVSLSVAKAALSATAADTNRPYGAENPPLTGNFTGLVTGDNITAIYTTTATITSTVGTYPIVPNLVDPGSKLSNYDLTTITGTLSVNKAPLSVTAADTSRPYGAENPPLTGNFTGLVTGDNITAIYTTTATITSTVGTYPIVPNLADPGSKLSNYDLTTITGTLSVNKAPLSVTATSQTNLVGDPLPALTFTATGWVNGETAASLTGVLTTTAIASSPVGIYPITLGTLSSDSYQISFTPGTLTIVGLDISISSAELVEGLPVVSGTATPGRQVTITMDVSGANTSAQAVYQVTADLNEQWSLNTATATPSSGTLPPGGLTTGMRVVITATLVGAANPATVTLGIEHKVYIPMLFSTS